MSTSFPSLGLSTPASMNYFFSVLNWCVSQAAPFLMILFAAYVVGMVARVIYTSIYPQSDVAQIHEIDEEE